MSIPYRPGEYERLYAESMADLKDHGLNDTEATVITRLSLGPQTELKIMEDLDLTRDEFWAIHQGAAEKYLANGGKQHWQS